MRSNYYKINTPLFISMLLLLVHCDFKINPPNTSVVKTYKESNAVSSMDLPPDFGSFYDRFHTDSNYQIDHIMWPLPGKVIENEQGELQSTTNWTQEEWTIHQKMPSNGAYDLNYTTTGPDYVQEIIINRTSGHGLIRRWRKINGDWILSYYSGLLSAKSLETL